MTIEIGVWINGICYEMTPEAQRDLLMQLGVQSVKDIAPKKLEKRGLVPVGEVVKKEDPR